MLNRLLAAGAAALTLAGAAQAPGHDERHFLSDALKGDNSEMALGQLAAERAASPGVRDFGRMLHDDHAHARDEVIRVGSRLGVRPTKEMTPEARQEMAKLRRLHGRAFDREFVRYMVDDHRKDIAEFRRQAGGRGPVADLARTTLPDLQRHLDTATQLSRG
jgi:putative membrane protein